jgi:peptidoglycan DL-endopeptidase CwlO
MRRVRLLLVPAFALGAGLLISACGGDSSPETPIVVPTETQSSSSSLSKAEFIAQADSSCKEANAAIEQFAASGQGLTEAGQIADLRKGIVDQIRQLGPPDEDRTTLDQFIKATEDEVSAGQKIALAEQRSSDTTQFESELDSAKTAAETAASSYGFQECGQQISSSGTSTSSSSGVVVPSSPSTGSSGGTGGGTSGGSTGGGSTGGGGSGGGGSGGVGPG